MTDNKLAQQFNFKSFMKFSIPTMVMMVFMSLYQTVDGVFLSNLVGELALTALNVVYPYSSVVIAVAVMLASGGSAVIGMNMGMGNSKAAKENFTFFILAALVFSGLMTAFSLIFIDEIILFLGATPKIYQLCYEYLIIMIASTPLAMLQLLFQAFFVAAGKPKLGLILTIASGAANLILDYVFLGILHMGIAGAALATAIGYGITAIYGLFYFALCRKGQLYFVKPKPRLRVLGKACFNGSSEMVNNLAVAITTLLFNLVGLHFLREEGVAAISIVLYSQYIMTAVFMGFSNGVAPIFSFKHGAQDWEQIRKLFKVSMIFVSVLSVFTFLLAFFVAKPIGLVFARHNPYVLKLAIHGFLLFSISLLFTGLNIFTSSLFTAFSNGLISGLLSFLRTFVLLVISLLVLPAQIGADGIWLAIPLAEGIAILFSLLALFCYRKKYHFILKKS